MSETKERKGMGIVLWKGKSLLDGERIMVIATGALFHKSKNRKTGNIVQTYILRRDIAPMLARRMGEDKSICGDCKHREKSTCYVNLCHGPRVIFTAFHDGSYRDWQPGDEKYFQGKIVRIGSYGDPASVPFGIWEMVCNAAKGWTGYTHQWKTCDQRLKKFCMASVDSIIGYNKEYMQAQLMGWRTFRVRESLDNPVLENEFVCPASKEAGVKTNCESCRACNGTFDNKKKSVVIALHADSEAMGSMWRRNRYIKTMTAIKNKKKWRRDYQSERKAFEKVCRF